MRHQPVPSVRARRRRALLIRTLALVVLAALLMGWARRTHTPETSSEKSLPPSEVPASARARADAPGTPTDGPSGRIDGPRRFADVPTDCVHGLVAANGLPAGEATAWCALDAPFKALMAERADPQAATLPHDRLCAKARAALADADERMRAWGDCGAMAERSLDWSDAAWMTGCFNDAAWMDRYRAFRLNRMTWNVGNPVCDTTKQAWAQENNDWQRRLDAADLSELKLCVFVALKVFAPPSDDVGGLRDAVDRCYATYPDPSQMVPFEVP